MSSIDLMFNEQGNKKIVLASSYINSHSTVA